MVTLLVALAGCCFAPGKDEPVSLADKNGRTIRVEIKGADAERVHVIRLPDRKPFSLDRATLDPVSMKKVVAWEKRRESLPTEPHVFKYRHSESGTEYEVRMKLPKGPIVARVVGKSILIRFDTEGGKGVGKMKIDMHFYRASERHYIKKRLKNDEKKRANAKPEELVEQSDHPAGVPIEFAEFKGTKTSHKTYITYWLTNGSLVLNACLSQLKGGPINQDNSDDVIKTIEVDKHRIRK